MNSISKLEKIPPIKLFPLINTFNMNKLKITRAASEIKKEIGLSESDLVIGNIASLTYRKGQDILLKAFKIINEGLPSTKLIFIGGEVKEFKQKLLDLARSSGLSDKVFFLGRKV